MSNVFFNRFEAGSGPGRQQNLFISPSKHLYLTKAGYLRWQKKAIDPRLLGAKTLLIRLAVFDVDTGSVYGEYHTQEGAKDLIGFLARAWSAKADHPMKGVPRVLNLPAAVLKDDGYRRDLSFAVSHTDLHLGKLPSGFSAGVNALKQLEDRVASLPYRGASDGIGLDIMHATAGVTSDEASWALGQYLWNEGWKEVQPPTEYFLNAVDALYVEPGAWRSGAFKLVLNGIPNRH
ncbi:hypothetical protein [Noviherbaspirillum malthae]|uniref:hypothetical protein n=1 Tax=Noviherbaspirillum malthae TaxID=1260987 RepID=UPI00189011C9|nr:hypothetical protein [Noviherbaspirillum malthae]